ncbi:MAG: hypothetical protein AB7O91_00730 [Sphingomonas sp.]
MQGRTIAAALAGGFGAMMLGVTLGNSAISQINPIHFQGAALHPRDRGAAIDPNRPTVIPNNYEQLYGWSQGSQARAAACPDCTFERPAAPATEVQVASATYFGSREEESRREAQERREIDDSYIRRLEDAERRRAMAERLARYAHYRVSEDEVVRERPSYAENDVILSDEGVDDQK